MNISIISREKSILGCYVSSSISYQIAGDEFDDEEMLDWLTDPNVMEVSDQIEKVNRKMFEKLTKRNDHMAVFFCKLRIRNSELTKLEI